MAAVAAAGAAIGWAFRGKASKKKEVDQAHALTRSNAVSCIAYEFLEVLSRCGIPCFIDVIVVALQMLRRREEQASELRVRLQGLNAEITELEATITRMSSERENIRMDLKRTENAQTESVNTLQRKLNFAETSLREAQAAARKTQIEDSKAKVDLAARMQMDQAHNDLAKGQLAALKATLAELTSERAEVESRLQRVEEIEQFKATHMMQNPVWEQSVKGQNAGVIVAMSA